MKTFIHHEFPKLERKTASDGTRVYSTPSGRAYPSVTTVTGLLNKDSLLEWRRAIGEEEANKISARAASRGTRIHKLCEDFLRGDIVKPNFIDKEMWDTILPELTHIDNIHALESKLYSDHLQVAGTVDCIAEYKGKLAVIDFKTSSRIKYKDDIQNYFMQCAAYAVAFEERIEIPVPNILVIMGVENEKNPLLFFEKRNRWIEQFKDLRLEYKRTKGL